MGNAMATTKKAGPTETDFERADALTEALLDALFDHTKGRDFAAAHLLAAVALFDFEVLGRILQVWRDQNDLTKEQATGVVGRHAGMLVEGLAATIEELWPAANTERPKGGPGEGGS